MKEFRPIQVELDTTGEFLSTIPQNIQSTLKFGESEQDTQELLNTNIHLLYAHRKEILNNSEWSNVCVAVGHNLAYSGRSNLRNVTLEVVLTWLETEPAAQRIEDDGTLSLMYFFAGSPLSGMNRCSFIKEDGSRYTDEVRPFRPVWQSFMEINRNNQEEGHPSEKVTLEEVILEIRKFSDDGQ